LTPSFARVELAATREIEPTQPPTEKQVKRALIAVACIGLAACADETTAPVTIAPSYELLTAAALPGSAAYNHIPNPLPPNVPSLGFQATQTAEFGDYVTLGGTARRAGSVTVVMSDWAKHSDYPTMDAAGYSHPITLNIYSVSSGSVGTSLASVTQTFTIPWRPEADVTCAGGTAWRASDNQCYNGFAFTITFDLRDLALTLPNNIIVGIAYNTNTWGYAPIGHSGPYESLNVGAVGGSPSAGTDVDPNAVFWNTMTAANYSDGGSGGVGTFRLDSNWTGNAPAFSVNTYTVATTANACKNNGWRALSRADGSGFKNQGECLNYVAGK
jgi:hypothetical protein